MKTKVLAIATAIILIIIFNGCEEIVDFFPQEKKLEKLEKENRVLREKIKKLKNKQLSFLLAPTGIRGLSSLREDGYLTIRMPISMDDMICNLGKIAEIEIGGKTAKVKISGLGSGPSEEYCIVTLDILVNFDYDFNIGEVVVLKLKAE